MNQAETAVAMLSKLPGSRIFAVPPNTKKASGDWTSAASDDPQTVATWFDLLPDHNVGLFIGDRVAVIDIEGPNKANEKAREGMANFGGLEQTYGALPPTLTTLTPSEGKHKFYVLPPGVVFNRKAKLFGQEGIELRSGVHYVLLPPSRVEGYGDYIFADGLGLDDVEVAILPDAWVEAIRSYEQPEQATPSRLDLFQSTSSGGTERKPVLEPILTGCAFMRHVVQDAAELSEPDWYAGLSIIGRCENGRELAHKTSELYPRYNAAETDRKIEHALTAAKPSTCRYIGGDLGFEGCKTCPFRAFDKSSPIALGHQKLDVVKEQKRLVYIANIEQYVDVTTGRRYTRTSLSDMVSHRVGKNPHSQLMQSKTMPKVEAADYLVGNDQLIVGTDAGSVLNTWRRDGVEPCDGDARTVFEFLKYLVPDQPSRDHLLDYLAHLLQRGGEKILHALILTGPQGVGKSTLNRIVQKLFGRNARKIEGEQLKARWTEALVNVEVLIAEEAAHGEKFETYERLKSLVTDQFFPAEQKNMPVYDGRTPRGILIASNHDNPVALATKDRRYCVIASAEEKADRAFYDAINGAIDDPTTMGAFAGALLKRNLSKFDAKGAPPMTAAKELAVAASRTPLGQVLDALIEDGDILQEVVTLNQIKRALDRSGWAVGNLSPQRVARELRARGAITLDRLRTTEGLDRPWAIRDMARWKAATPEEIRKELYRPLLAEKFAQMPNVVAMAMQFASGAQEAR